MHFNSYQQLRTSISLSAFGAELFPKFSSDVCSQPILEGECHTDVIKRMHEAQTCWKQLHDVKYSTYLL